MMPEPSLPLVINTDDIVDTLREPLLVLSGDLRVKWANRSFYRTFQVNSNETVGQLIYELGDGQWNIPALRHLLEEILPNDTTFEDFEVTHEFQSIGRKVMLLNSRRMCEAGKQAETILLAIEDITERRQAERLVQDALEYAENIVETVREPMLVLDGQLQVRTANRSFYRTFRVTSEDTQGHLLYDLGNGQWEIPKLRSLLEEILPKQTTFEDYEVTHNFEFIGRRVMLLNARRILRHGNPTELILLAIEDITERKRLEDERRELETRFTSLVKNIRDHSIFTLDLEGRITSWNRESEHILGYNETEVIGQHFSVIFTPEDRNAGIPCQELATALREGRAEDERWHLRKNGERLWGLGIVTPTQDAEGNHTGFSKILRDMTNRRRAEEALLRQNALLQAVNDNTTELIFVKDRAGRLTYVNAATLRVIGMNAEQAIGSEDKANFRVPAEHDAIAANDRRVLETGETLTTEESYTCADGQKRIFLSTKNPMWDEQGQIVGVIGVSLDITDRKQSQDRLAAELEATTRLHALTTRLLFAADLHPSLQDVLDNAIETCGADFGNIQLFNSKAQVLEIVAQRGFRKDFLDYFRTVRVDDGSACAQAMQSGERLVIEDVEADAPYEPHRPIAAVAGYRAVQFTPLKAHDGSIVGILSTHYRTPHCPSERDQRLLDLYARHAADLIQRSRLEQALKDADRRKDEFLATLAHELRNPMAPISSAVQLLGKMGPPYAKLQQLREIIERNVGHMVRLVDDLTEMSRITAGKIELQKERLNLADVVENAIETSGDFIKARRHELTIDISPQPVQVKGDVVRLTQVVANLLNNAAKYTPEGGHLWISVERQGGEGVVRVWDNGPGIPAEMLDKVFELFTQIQDGQHRLQSGLGIGLALVKRLVEMHGGTIVARRARGGGAEFVVQIPLVSDAGQQIDSDDEAANEIDQTPCRILVVDDNSDAADCLAMLLSADGHKVRTAHDGRAAIEEALTFNPNIILLDLGMPGMDGFETASSLRQLPGGAQIVIVALTGWGQEQDRRLTSEAGFNFHLVKPVRYSDLHHVLEESIKLKAQCPVKDIAPAHSLSLKTDNGESESMRRDVQPASESDDIRFSKTLHDLRNCFFGIKMAVEILENLKLGDQTTNDTKKRMLESIQKDCERGGELTAKVRELLACQEE